MDQTLEAELPGGCPHCGGEVEETGIEKPYQTEIPEPRAERIEFRIHVGRCKRCRRRVQGRHRRQTSDAVGGAASQLGARAVASATELNKGMGLSHGKTAAVLETAFGLRVSRGGLAQAFQRVARKQLFHLPKPQALELILPTTRSTNTGGAGAVSGIEKQPRIRRCAQHDSQIDAAEFGRRTPALKQRCLSAGPRGEAPDSYLLPFVKSGRSAGISVCAMIWDPLAVGCMPSAWIVPGTWSRSLYNMGTNAV